MTDYIAPVADIRFAATQLAGFNEIAALPGADDLNVELFDSILEEGGRFAGGVLGPLNVIGDKQGSRLENGVVRTPDGWVEAYRGFVDGGCSTRITADKGCPGWLRPRCRRCGPPPTWRSRSARC